MKILFIGNSFTARNNLPGLIADLADDDHPIEWQLISAGGASLRMHWNAGNALKAIQDGGFDIVVLQEQSTLPIKNRTRTHENIRLFDAAIKEAGSRTLLYLTWARRHAPETQAALTEAYCSITGEINAQLAPVGPAWERFRSTHSAPELYDEDGSHPSLAGSYLAACVFHAILFQELLIGGYHAPKGLTPDDCRLLEECAWETCGTFSPPSAAGTAEK